MAAGSRGVRLQIHAGARVVRAGLFDIGVDDTAYPYILFLSQAETERILDEHLTARGATVERGVELVDLTPATTAAGPNGVVTCQLQHPDGQDETIDARFVVGCDGPTSTVRHAAGIPFEGRAYPQSFVLADLEADGLEPGWLHGFLAARGIMFFFPLGSPATWRLIAMRPQDDSGAGGPAGTEDGPLSLDEVQRLVDGYSSTTVRLHDPVWMTNFRLHHRGARHYRAGRLFVAGDAAHVHSPVGAQGMNTGIQDSVNLGWKLGLVLAGRANPDLLDTYESERAPVGRTVLKFTDRVFTLATRASGPLVRMVRTTIAPHLVPVLLRLRSGRSYAFRTVSELGIRYRNSAASTEGQDAPSRGPRAGDRLPDASVSLDGKPGTLHEALSGGGYHLILCGPAGSWPAATAAAIGQHHQGLVTVHRLSRDTEPGALQDPSGLALRRLGLTGLQAALYLVRPDGYIGYRSGPSGLPGLQAYLGRWLR